MRRRERTTAGDGVLVVGACALLALGCGGEGPTDSDTRLGAEESSDLAAAVAEQAETALVARTEASAPAGSSGESDTPLGGSILFSRTRACDLGGAATLAGRARRNFDPDSRELTVDVSMTIVHDSCVVRSARRTLTLTGSPGLDVEAGYRQLEGRLDGPQRATVQGDVEWRTESRRTGSCRISVETVLDPARATLSVRGEACGFSVDRTVDR